MLLYGIFAEIIDFDFKRNKYYFFTIKHNHTVALYDNATDMVALITYVKRIMLMSPLTSIVYCFELDSVGRLHIHGIATSPMKIHYKNLHRDWGVTHHFSEIKKLHNTSKAYRDCVCHDISCTCKVIKYILKQPVGPAIQSVKSLNEKNQSMIIDTYAYW